jgi:hypothetical protein
MTFEEAGARFAQLRAQYQAGALPPAQYQQMLAQLQVQDPAGRWWQIEPNSGQWVTWNGSQWVPAQGAAAAPAPQAYAQAAPQAYAQPMPQGYAQPQGYPAQQPRYPAPAQQPYAQPQGYGQPGYPPQPQQQSVTVPGKKGGSAIWDGLAPVVPGLAVGVLQQWPTYKKDPTALASFAIPSLLPAVLIPLVPVIGRYVAILLVLGCLAWLSWPLIQQASDLAGNAKALQRHAGRGLVGVSMLYMIPRIWRAGK